MEKKTFAEKLDWVFNKLLPKKFIVVTVATIIVFAELNPPPEYWYILIAYFGINGLGKFAEVLKDKRK